jgi:hypothetical protein
MTEMEPRFAALLAHCESCGERPVHAIAEDIINLWRFSDLLPNRAILYLNEMLNLYSIDENMNGICGPTANPAWVQLIRDFLSLISKVDCYELDVWKAELQMMLDKRHVQ